jgi:prepilin-type N-terminal cleavage/methylation domain-containing protein
MITNTLRRRTRTTTTTTSAFTLIEILLVVAILGTAAAIILPQIGARDDLRAQSMARSIMADLAFVQSRAVSTQRKHFVRFDVANNTYEVLDAISGTEHLIDHPVDHIPFKVTLGPARKDSMRDVQFDAVSFDGRPVLYFDELGTPHSYDPATQATSAMAAGSVRLKSHAFTITFTVEPYSGELKVN